MNWLLALALGVAAIGVDVGWQPAGNGELEYIIQIEPELLETLKAGDEIQVGVRPELRNVKRYRIQVGNDPVPRIAPAPRIGVVSSVAAARSTTDAWKPPVESPRPNIWVPRLELANEPAPRRTNGTAAATTNRNELETIELNPPLLSTDTANELVEGYQPVAITVEQPAPVVTPPSFEAPPTFTTAPRSPPTSVLPVDQWQRPQSANDKTSLPRYQRPGRAAEPDTIQPTKAAPRVAPFHFHPPNHEPHARHVEIEQVETENATVRMQPFTSAVARPIASTVEPSPVPAAALLNTKPATIDTAVQPTSRELPLPPQNVADTRDKDEKTAEDESAKAQIEHPPSSAHKMETPQGASLTDHPSSPSRPWIPLTLALFALFASLGGNMYQGWITWDLRRKYRQFLNRLRVQE